MNAGFQLGPGIWTRLRHRVFDAEGEPLEERPTETGLVFGYGALLPALEAALEGKPSGARLSVELGPKDAYGARDPERFVEVARDEFPPDVAPGDHFEAESEDGTAVVLRVLEVTDESVVLDLNHPLAGQRVRFEVEVLEARPATAEELALAEAALAEEAEAGARMPAGQLIEPARLLRRGSKR